MSAMALPAVDSPAWAQALANPRVLALAQSMGLNLADPGLQQQLIEKAIAVQPSCAVAVSSSADAASPALSLPTNHRVARALKAYADVAAMV